MKPLPDLARDGILTKSFWNQVKSTINANFREVTLQPGVGYTVTSSPGGPSLYIPPSKVAGASAPVPFQVVMQSKPGGAPGELQWGVLPTGNVYRSLRPDDVVKFGTGDSTTWTESTTDLLASKNPATDDASWRDMGGGGDLLWMTGVYGKDDADVFCLLSLSINSMGKGDTFTTTGKAWSNNNAYIENDNATPPSPKTFQTFRKVIAYYTTPPGESAPRLFQCMEHDQLIRAIAVDGAAAYYPFDHSGGCLWGY